MVQIWSIGERKFGGDFRRRMIMFHTMVKSISDAIREKGPTIDLTYVRFSSG